MAVLETIRATTIENDIPLTEPQIIDSPFVNGTFIAVEDGVVCLTSWTRVHTYEAHCQAERRICSRITMSNAQARRLVVELQRALAQGGH